MLAAVPVIHGDLSEYAALPAISLGGEGNAAWALARAGWDAQALYLAFDVADTSLIAAATGGSGLWMGTGWR